MSLPLLRHIKLPLRSGLGGFDLDSKHNKNNITKHAILSNRIEFSPLKDCPLKTYSFLGKKNGLRSSAVWDTEAYIGCGLI